MARSPFRIEQRTVQLVRDQLIELVHRDGRPGQATCPAAHRSRRCSTDTFRTCRVRKVMPPPQLAQVARPVKRIGPVTTRGGVSLGLRDFKRACTASNKPVR